MSPSMVFPEGTVFLALPAPARTLSGEPKPGWGSGNCPQSLYNKQRGPIPVREERGWGSAGGGCQ